MKIGNKHAIGENLLYLLVWASIFLVPVLNSQMLSELHVNLEEAWIVWRQLIPYLSIFLVHNYLIAPRYLLHRKPVHYLLVNIVLVVTAFSIVHLYQQSVMNEASYIAQRDAITNHEIYWNVLFALFMNGTNGGIKLLYQSLRDEQQMEILKQEQLRAEMNALTYQMNPHFFMNTLNNIHALIDIDSEVAKTAVIDLSKMMRYVLYDSEKELVSLANDIQFLKNYIDLMRIRYNDNVEITLDYPHELPEGVSLPPLLLIVFIENSFKHGVSYNRKSYIHISIFYADGMLTTLVSNSSPSPDEPQKAPGIGIENVRKRLDLIYGAENYTIETHHDTKSYTVKLVIPTLHA